MSLTDQDVCPSYCPLYVYLILPIISSSFAPSAPVMPIPATHAPPTTPADRPRVTTQTHGIRNTVISCCLKYRRFSSSINTKFK